MLAKVTVKEMIRRDTGEVLYIPRHDLVFSVEGSCPTDLQKKAGLAFLGKNQDMEVVHARLSDRAAVSLLVRTKGTVMPVTKPRGWVHKAPARGRDR